MLWTSETASDQPREGLPSILPRFTLGMTNLNTQSKESQRVNILIRGSNPVASSGSSLLWTSIRNQVCNSWGSSST